MLRKKSGNFRFRCVRDDLLFPPPSLSLPHVHTRCVPSPRVLRTSPRRCTHAMEDTATTAEALGDEAPLVDPFTTLPLALALQCFARVPVDTRLRCAEVCPDWRAMLTERSLWTRVDLAAASRVTPALLRAAAAKAGGALEALDVSGVWQPLFEDGVLREVLAANAGALRELRCLRGPLSTFMSVPILEALLSAAPQLRVCEADVMLDDEEEARRALRNEGVFAPLRLRAACLSLAATAAHAPLFADMAAHASLAELHPYGVSFDVPEVLDAFVDAALLLPRLRAVNICYCHLLAASVPTLARLLGSRTLVELSINNEKHSAYYHVLLDAPGAALLGDVLRTNTTLTSLSLRGAMLLRNRAAAAALLGALTRHASLRKLRITHDSPYAPEDGRHAGKLLAALVSANTPALKVLQVQDNKLGDSGLRPVFKAMSHNKHLRTFDC